MIARRHRLPATLIERFYRQATRSYTPSLIIFWRRSQQPFARVAIMVSRKVDNKATVRNLLRRRIAQVFNETIKIIPNLDLTISIKKNDTALVYQQEIEQWLEQRLKKQRSV